MYQMTQKTNSPIIAKLQKECDSSEVQKSSGCGTVI